MFDTLKIRLHCLLCRQSADCPIKYCPSEKALYTSFKIKDGYILLENPVNCIQPMKNLKD